MALSLIDLTTDYLTPEVLSKIAGLVRESPANAQKAMDAIFPVSSVSHVMSRPVLVAPESCYDFSSQAGVDLSPSSFASVLSGGSATDGLLKTGSNLLNVAV